MHLSVFDDGMILLLSLPRKNFPSTEVSFHTVNKYIHDEIAGEGVNVYVLDMGVYVDNPQFEGRASWGVTIPEGETDVDENGRGTHLAGTIASHLFGVAKKAYVTVVKILDSNAFGDMSDAIKGVEWVVKQHQPNIVASRKTIDQGGFKGSVALLNPITGDDGHFWSLRSALDAATRAGVHVVVAAPSNNMNECPESIAPVNSICVGASTLSDEKAIFSNFGPCVKLFAPGYNVLSTFVGPAARTLSGTEMAAAHVAGLVAYLLSQQPKGTTPEELKRIVLELATPDMLRSLPDESNNLLAFNNATYP